MHTTVVASPVSVSKAFSPGHLTGFVEIPSQGSSYLGMGSRGSGFSIDKGITTSVQVYDNKRDFQVTINGIKTESAEVSNWVIEQYLKLVDKPFFIKVDHEADIPIGYGLGSSGAAALSLSYALNDALDARFGKDQAAQIAHHAEISCKTGLGTVIAEYAGGFEMRTSIGAPGIGVVERVRDMEGYRAVVLCMSPISTKSFLTNHISLINGLGSKMLKKLQKTRDVNDFLKMSFEFAASLGLTEGLCKEPIKALRSNGFNCGVALFGETVFTIIPKEKAKQVHDLLKRFDGTLLVCNIDTYGARVL